MRERTASPTAGGRSWRAAGTTLVLVLLLTWPALATPLASDLLTVEDGRTRGQVRAPVTLIEYSDFTCGFCRKFHQETWPRILAKYVDTGKVRFIYRDFPRAYQGPGVNAAVAARCADEQARFWPMHDRLFHAEGRLGREDLERYATELKLDRKRFATCLQDKRLLDAVFSDREEGTEFGFHGTPGFVLMRVKDPAEAGTSRAQAVVIPGAFPYEVFEEQIERLLQAADRKG